MKPCTSYKTQWSVKMRRQKNYKNQRCWLSPWKQHLLGRARLSHIQTRQNSSTKKGKCTQIPPFRNRLLASILWKISFLQWSINEYINHNLEQVPCLGVISPSKMDSVFCLYGIFFSFFVLFYIFPPVSLFCLSCREGKEKKEERLKELKRMWKGARGWSWVDREVERVWKECGRGK